MSHKLPCQAADPGEWFSVEVSQVPQVPQPQPQPQPVPQPPPVPQAPQVPGIRTDYGVDSNLTNCFFVVKRDRFDRIDDKPWRSGLTWFEHRDSQYSDASDVDETRQSARGIDAHFLEELNHGFRRVEQSDQKTA